MAMRTELAGQASTIRRLAPLLIGPVLSLALLGGASAETLPIEGSYGNTDGCAYAKSGEATGSNDFFLLTQDRLVTASLACSFAGVASKPDKAFTLTVQCEEEGNTDALAPFEIDIVPGGSNAYTLKVDDGQVWGPLSQCR